MLLAKKIEANVKNLPGIENFGSKYMYLYIYLRTEVLDLKMVLDLGFFDLMLVGK